ncbi:Hypothetical protein SRAE_X000254300 [Strongyloides ratti]|uniref:Uncharacterized protein n=1 Tax=Strongyloides ratti TaxID=34506 RepID=A0A090KTE3_STRRB|nr:Hypothetical protein SRAE_X000254300 [Strongyloides ratti]CEF60760.1 Hypothetical protein SRAE_X000254300 [Strongyloides ratti]
MEKIKDLKIKILLELDEVYQNSITYKKLIEDDLKKYLDLKKKSNKNISNLKYYNNIHIPPLNEIQKKYNLILEENIILKEELLTLENNIIHEKKVLDNILSASFKCENQKFSYNKKVYKEDFNKFERHKEYIKKEIENGKINLDKICLKRKLTDEVINRMVDDIKNAIRIVYLVSSNMKIAQKSSNKIFQFSKTNALEKKILLFENLSYEEENDNWLLFTERYIKYTFVDYTDNKNFQSFYQMKINEMYKKKDIYLLILKMIEEVLTKDKKKLIDLKENIKKYDKLFEEENNKLKLSIVPDVFSNNYIYDKFVIQNVEEELYIASNKLKIQKEWIKGCKSFICEISLSLIKSKNIIYNNENITFSNKLNNDSLEKSYVKQVYSCYNQIKKLKKEIRIIRRSILAKKNEIFLLNEKLEELEIIVKELEKKEKTYDKSFFTLSTIPDLENKIFKENNIEKINNNKELENLRMLYENNKNYTNQTKIKIEDLKNDINKIDNLIKEEKTLYLKNSTQFQQIEKKLIIQKQQQPFSIIINYYNNLKQEKSLLLKNISCLEKDLLKVSEVRMNIIKKTIN